MKPANQLLSATGTTIFTIMSALATEHGAINLGQGFPDTDGPADIIEAAAAALRDGMLEGQAVAEALGVRFAIDIDKRIEGAAEVGRHKTSMLQDLELGRPLEVEALLGAVVEMAGWVGVIAPISRAVLALVRQRAAMRE